MQPVINLEKNVAGKRRASPETLSTSEMRRYLKKTRYETKGAKKFRKANKRTVGAVKKANEGWLGAQCEEIETCLNKNKN